MSKTNVVYVLGAGFSEPYGLPIMSTFMDRARDIYETDNAKHSRLKAVIDKLDRLNSHSLRINISNIEEVLSVLQMAELLTNDKDAEELDEDQMKYFIRTVIMESTKEIPVEDKDTNLSDGLGRHVFNDRGGVFSLYGFFVASLFGMSIIRRELRRGHDLPVKQEVAFSRFDGVEEKYSVVTTNYDCILEKFEQFINAHLSDPSRDRIEFKNEYVEKPKPTSGRVMPLLKLHGTVELKSDIISKNDITVMTWNKNIYRPETAAILREAYRAIRDAHHIRIIGYSMPDTDSYLKYLLKVATLNHKNLKSIDVLTLDDDKQSTKKRYEALLGEKGMRWKSGKVEDYFSKISRLTNDNISNNVINCNWLEAAHKSFFEDAEKLQRV